MFVLQLGRMMEVYIDDMVVKRKEDGSHLEDLEECFHILRQFNMKLNPAKCAFSVASGQFLGYDISRKGIEANPPKYKPS